MIKNEKTQLSKAVKSLKSKRKLGLTGTPIQNNILELWSIFDFVMPGYLGEKKQFRKEHRTLMNMNMMSLELNKMRLTTLQKRKLEFLHAKVLPFIMRREKKDVLKDLPPKIIQDHECIMTKAQRQIYQVFQDKEKVNLETETAKQTLSNNFSDELKKTQKIHENKNVNILSTLNNLRKIVNHPFLLDSNPLYSGLVSSIKKSIPRNNKLIEFFLGGKFYGLKSILNSLDYQEDDIFSCKNNPNKLIIFSRYRDCCKLIVRFFNKVFPFIKTVHLSNELDLRERSKLVEQFRVDKTNKVIILTTKIGGLGLNLSSANIVIMFDHDFNPMNDLQAMDRAHRIGQKKCVNVFRMVMKGRFR
jgi:TATA-binding protein-associated factor